MPGKRARRSGWTDAMRRIAAASGCCFYARSTTETADACADGMDRIVIRSYSAGLCFLCSRAKALPMGITLKGKVFEDETRLYALGASNFETAEPEKGKTAEAAAKAFLEKWKGRTLGINDGVMKNGRTGYVEEIFTPVADIPDFRSLSELNLKLAALGV